MRYIFHPEAVKEYSEAAKYYKERSLKVSKAFIDEVEKSIFRILSSPKMWRILEEDIRRYLLPHFPYGIYYTIENGYVLIISVMHLSRKPGYWKSRIIGNKTIN